VSVILQNKNMSGIVSTVSCQGFFGRLCTAFNWV